MNGLMTIPHWYTIHPGHDNQRTHNTLHGSAWQFVGTFKARWTSKECDTSVSPGTSCSMLLHGPSEKNHENQGQMSSDDAKMPDPKMQLVDLQLFARKPLGSDLSELNKYTQSSNQCNQWHEEMQRTQSSKSLPKQVALANHMQLRHCSSADSLHQPCGKSVAYPWTKNNGQRTIAV